MKYKVEYEKSNFLMMSLLISLCYVTCIGWLLLRLYGYFFLYLGLSIILSYVYYFTYYIISDDYLIIGLGFIKVKIKYQNIREVKMNKNRILLVLKRFNLHIYPQDKDNFLKNIQKHLTNKDTYFIMKKK